MAEQKSPFSLLTDPRFKRLSNDQKVRFGEQVFQRTIGKTAEYGGMQDNEKQAIRNKFFNSKVFQEEKTALGKGLDVAAAPLKGVIEFLEREEAAFANVAMGFAKGEVDEFSDVKDLFAEGASGKTIDRRGDQHIEFGDVIKELTNSEAAAQVFGFAAALLTPTSFIPIGGLAAKGIRGAKVTKAMLSGNRTAAVLAKHGVKESGIRAVAKGKKVQRILDHFRGRLDEGDVFKGFGDMFKHSDVFPNIREVFDKHLKAVGDQEKAVKRLGEFLETEKQRLGKRFKAAPAKKRFKEQRKRLGKQLPSGPFRVNPLSQAQQYAVARKRAMSELVEQFRPATGKQLADGTYQMADGSLVMLPDAGSATSRIGRYIQADEITKAIAKGTPEEKARGFGLFGKIGGAVMLPFDVARKNPITKALVNVARRSEVIGERLTQTFKQNLHTLQRMTGIKTGSTQDMQAGMLMDTFEDLTEIPTGERFMKELITKLQKQNPTVPEQTVIDAATFMFPNGSVSDDVLMAVERGRRMTRKAARHLGLKPDNNLNAYFTRIYGGLISGKGTKLDLSQNLAILSDFAAKYGVDSSTHLDILRRMEGVYLPKGTVKSLAPNIRPPKEAFFKNVQKRATNLDAKVAEDLFMSRDWSLLRTMNSYTNGVARKVKLDNFLPGANEALDALNVSSKDVNFNQYWRRYIDAFRGVPQGVGGKALKQFAAFEAWRQFIGKIGLRPAAALINLSQTPINTLPKLIGQYGFKEGGQAFFQGLGEYFTARGMGRIRASGVLLENPSAIADIQFGKQGAQAFMNKTAGYAGMLFDKVEEFNRGVAFLAGRRAFMNKSMKEGMKQSTLASANDAGRILTDTANFIFGKSNRPLFFQTPMGSILGRFKLFGLNQFKFLREANAKQAIATIGVIDAIGGPDALALEKIRADLNENAPNAAITKAMNELQRASLAGHLGIDLSGGRLGIPFYQEVNAFTNPRSGKGMWETLASFAGPSFSDIEQMINIGNIASMEGMSDNTIKEVARLANIGSRDLIEFIEIASEGKLEDPKGRTRIDIPKKDAAKFLMGFSTPDLARQFEEVEFLNKSKDKYLQAVNTVKKLYLQGDTERAMRIHAKGVEINGEIVPINFSFDSFGDYAMKSIFLDSKERTFDSLPRTLKFALADKK